MTANNPMDILRPLGIEEFGGFPATRDLIRTVLQITERVGYVYKAMFLRIRPNAAATDLRPFIANPPHTAFPSNHAFQNHSLALTLIRCIPEVPATAELLHVAHRIAENREFAGVHYRSDSEAGYRLARQFSPYLFQICRYKMRAAQREWYGSVG